MIRVGIIGAGFMGRMHFDAYQKHSARAQVVTLCDKEAARRIGDWRDAIGNLGDYGSIRRDFSSVKPSADYHELLNNPAIDLIDICAPTFLHREIAVAALAAGKHVLCEKPMAATLVECDAMIAAAEKTDRTFMIAQCTRFWPEYVFLKQLVETEKYGRLESLHLRRQAARPGYTLNNWINNPELSGGMILDLHIHDVDYALFLLGKPKAIEVSGVYNPQFGADRVYAFWHYDKNRPIVLEGFWDMPPDYPFNAGISAKFEHAAVHWDMASQKPLTVYLAGGGTETPEFPVADGYIAEIGYFLDCVEQNKKPTHSTPQESRMAVALALAEGESLRTGKPVDLV
ncbi:MAG: Gfo/Idh/MocA family oxidoreductase [Phycisphaerales bacterium]|nr:Gfo/Idh/MocA family oxidoreductase [Phycisphaerales bacterium]